MTSLFKVCNKCELEKHISFFGKRKNDNKTKTVYYNSQCKDCMMENTRLWIDKHRDRYLKYQREYQQLVRDMRK